MHYFQYRDRALYCDEVDVREVAEEVGTPFYLYSYRTLLRHCMNLHRAFGDTPHLTCYSMKANDHLAILSLLAREGIGVDIVSGGELYKALKAGFPPDRIVYSGVGKTDAEIRYALEEGILSFNVESLPELEVINGIAGEMGKTAPVGLRINPDVDPKTHPYISTGLKSNKFGISSARALETFRRAAEMPHIELIGIDAHIGSQLTTVAPFVESAEKLAFLVASLKKEGITLQYIDIGGGLGIQYHDENPPEPSGWVEAVLPALKSTKLKVIFEPGRALAGNAGILIVRVLYVKKTEHKTFVITDGGMNDLMRPSLYNAYHEIWPVTRTDAEPIVADVVGPICESSDFFAKDREIPKPKRGDLLAVMSAGAYGFSMSSNYNARPRVAAVMVREDGFTVIRERERYEDLIRGEES
ncbi:MAG: diaminopimelate decarboxylase [Candidatus Latescibacterota bacterium]|nr:MAG: diaminopimelate decarboxylase [Candidatus Latescibacterota bacterium]